MGNEGLNHRTFHYSIPGFTGVLSHMSFRLCKHCIFVQFIDEPFDRSLWSPHVSK